MRLYKLLKVIPIEEPCLVFDESHRIKFEGHAKDIPLPLRVEKVVKVESMFSQENKYQLRIVISQKEQWSIYE